MDHFAEVVSRAHGLELYETAFEAVNKTAMKRFGDSSYFKPVNAKRPNQTKSLDNPFGNEIFDCFGDSCNLQFKVCAVSEGCEIVLDSGSDATVIPMSMAGAGKPSFSQSSFSQRCTGFTNRCFECQRYQCGFAFSGWTLHYFQRSRSCE